MSLLGIFHHFRVSVHDATSRLPSWRDALRYPRFAAWVAAPGLVLTVVSLWFSGFWSWLVGMVFLFWLYRLGYLAAVLEDELRLALTVEREQCVRWLAGEDVMPIITAIKQEKGLLLQSLGAFPRCEAPGTVLLPDLCKVVVQEVYDAHIAGDAHDVNRLGVVLRDQVSSRFAPLTSGQAQAFMLGLLGTVVGLLLQALVAQGSGMEVVAGEGFFTGAILATTSTVLGICTAFYIRSCSSGLEREFSLLISSLVGVYRRLFTPALGGAVQSDLDHFVEKISANLRLLLKGFVDSLSEQLKTILPDILVQVDKSITQLIEQKVGAKVDETMKNFLESIRLIEQRAQNTATTLQAATSAISIQIERVVCHPDETSKRLEKTLVAASKIATEFESVAAMVKGITKSLEKVSDKLTTTTPSMATTPSQASADYHQLVKDQEHQLESVSTAIRALSDLVSGLSQFDRTIERQTAAIGANTELLVRQRDELAALRHPSVLDPLSHVVNAANHKEVEKIKRQGFLKHLIDLIQHKERQP